MIIFALDGNTQGHPVTNVSSTWWELIQKWFDGMWGLLMRFVDGMKQTRIKDIFNNIMPMQKWFSKYRGILDTRWT